MFNLNTASMGIRKAAYRRGIRDGEWSPIFQSENVAKVVSKNGKKEIVFHRDEIEHALYFTWEEIKGGE